ncbi:glycoside hydrolase family 3 C-terminal domain-containing protein [Sphaerotilus sp.]|uniref:glycoside hydrolase family 3 C-terminal domain-containing protein n=1 Tax=Sphaerotilus sp. TaxID=2093942 RepID=UPI002ACD3CCE|nr:glycoside hydrolase family 3 C-terminal domain-containing protein [Sphaerotilus sp.]MDZ7857954.1 glycoside hydrolase family 3 C-terminal domain-containing protein [Sphaerotilus sp.]
MTTPHLPALLDAMTLEEQVSLLTGADFWTTVAIPRLGIPAVKVTDGPNGARGGIFNGGPQTACFPIAIALGSTWDPALVAEAGQALAEESRLKGAGALLAPTVNLHRSTLNGRNFECYSEDPHLTGEIACGYIRGLQSGGVAATIKHFVCNDSEVERMSIDSVVGERTMRELYLVPFEKAVKEAGVQAVMTSYNRINGLFAGDNAPLVRDILRGQWGFDGLVMSDWFAEHTTGKSATAGMDLEMPGTTRHRGEALVQAVREGRVPAEDVRACAGRVLQFVERLGGFASPGIPEERAEDSPARRALIRRLGAAGSVLLKNEGGLLPLAGTARTLALIGPSAETARIMGGGSANVNALHRVTPRQGIEAQTDATILSVAGADCYRWVPVLNQPMAVDFYTSTDLSGEPAVQAVYLSTEKLWAGAVEDGIDPLHFSARATLTFVPPADGDYQVSITSAGLSRVLFDGVQVVEAWESWSRGDTYFTFGCAERIVSQPLRAGVPVTITVEFSSPTEVDVSFKALRLGVYLPRGESDLAAAEAAARQADVALVFIGLNDEWDCEGLDRPDMQLPHGQNALVERVVAANPNTVVVLQTGAPVELPWLDKVPAVLQAWYPGQECGHAIADVLTGAAEPGGRLPQTWPKRLADVVTSNGDPLRYPGVGGRVVYDEGVFIGYRHHDSHGVEPMFPFGHGLGYTAFQWGAVTVDRASFGPGETVTVSVSVTNTGPRAGSEVVQVYVTDPVSGVERPAQELKGFAKLHLQPGETGTATVTLGMRALAWFDEARGGWVAEAGAFGLRAGASSRDVRGEVEVALTGEWFAAA